MARVFSSATAAWREFHIDPNSTYLNNAEKARS
jgi:hypothetical protein